jgi:tetratricopeptide (TPR) repeat protein
VHELLSDIDRWQSLVEQARQAWQRALSACVGNEELVADQARARIEAVQTTLSSAEAGYRLARDLDDILAEAYTPIDDLRSRLGRTTARYANFFSRLGVDIDQADKARLGSAITTSPIRFALVAGLDNWAGFTAAINPQDPQLALLLGLARAADPDAWRDRFRDPAVWSDRAALTELAGVVDIERQSPTILATLGQRLQVASANSAALFKQAVLCHPRDFWLHLNAAIFAKEPGARVGLNLAACAIRPNSPMAYSNLSVSLREQGDLRGAVTAANRALAIDHNFVAAYVNLGRALRDSKDLPGAVAAFKKATEFGPKCAPAYVNLGFALRESNDLPGAVAACKKAIDLDPNSFSAHGNLGTALLLQGDKAGAVAAYKKAIELNPKSAPAYNNLGLALRLSNDWPGAVAAYKKAIEFDPGHFQAHHGLGMTLLSQGRHAEAEQAYLGAIKAQPAFALAYNDVAWLLATCPDDKVRDGKRAVEFATTACERTGWKVPAYLDTLAAAYAEAGQFEDAIRYETRALADPAFEARSGPVARQRLGLYQQKKPFRDQ